MGSEHNPYQAPSSDLAVERDDHQAGADTELATRGQRFAAALIDGLLQLALTAPLQYAAGVYDGFPHAVKPLSIPTTFAWGLLGFVFYLTLNGYLLAKNGQTLGKKALGIRIVNRADRQRTPLSRILTRRLAPMFAAQLVPVVGSLFAFVDPLFIFRRDRRCVHDHIADTVVVRA
jgi:uncharacterized RDD family membrane protein YckC